MSRLDQLNTLVFKLILNQWLSFWRKIKKPLKQLRQEVLQQEFLSIRKQWDCKVNLRAVFLQCFSPLHCTLLEHDKILTLKFAKLNFDKKMEVSQTGKMGMLWRINNIED